MRKIFLAPALLGLALTTGCTALLGGASVDGDEVERQIGTELAGQIGGPPRSVSCPGDLKGEAGAMLACGLVAADGTPRVANVTVTSVDGDKVRYDIKSPAPGAGTSPSASPSAAPTQPTARQSEVESVIVAKLAPQLDGTPRSATCPGDLRGEVGVRMECTLHFTDGTSRPVTVTVTSVVGTTVNFNIRLGGATG